MKTDEIELEAFKLYRSGQKALALGELEEILRQDPNNSMAHYNLALTLYELRRYEDCVNECERILTIDTNAPSINDSKTSFGKWSKDDTADVYCLHGLGLAFIARLRQDQEYWKKAKSSFDEAISIRNDAKFYHGLAAADWALGNRNNAKLMLLKAIEFDPTYYLAYGLLTKYQFRTGQFSDAIRNWAKAIRLCAEQGRQSRVA